MASRRKKKGGYIQPRHEMALSQIQTSRALDGVRRSIDQRIGDHHQPLIDQLKDDSRIAAAREHIERRVLERRLFSLPGLTREETLAVAWALTENSDGSRSKAMGALEDALEFGAAFAASNREHDEHGRL